MSLRARAASIIVVSCGFACGDTHVFIEQTWPTGHALVVVVADASDRPLEAAPRVYAPGSVPRLVLAAGGPVRFFLRSYLPVREGGPDLEGCGVRFDGDGGRLPEAETSWSTGVLELGDGLAVRPEPDTAGRELGLRYERCAPDRYPCERITVSPVSTGAIADLEIYQVVAVSDDLAFFRSYDAAINVGRIADGAATLFDSRAAPGGITVDLAWGGSTTLFGVTNRRAAYALSFEGEIVTRYTLTSTARGGGAGGGAAVVYGYAGVADVLAPGSAIESLSGDVEHLALVRGDRAAAYIRPHFFVFDGREWRAEHEARPSAFEKWDALAGDGDVFAAVDRGGQVLVRDEATRTWSLTERPIDDGPRWYGVAAAGRGRFLAAGDGGSLALWTGRAWCAPIATGTGATLRGVAASPSGRVAYAGGYHEPGATERAVVLRIDLPE